MITLIEIKLFFVWVFTILCIKFLIVSDQLIIVSVGLWQTSVSFVGHRNCLIFECSGIQIVLVTIYFRLLSSTFQSVFTLYLVCWQWQWRCGGRGGGRLNIVDNSSSNKGGSVNAPYGPNQTKSCSDANSWFGKGYKEHSEQSFECEKDS
jgi:hypothetical protein